MWLILPVLMVAFAAEELVPSVPVPAGHDLIAFFDSDAAKALLSGGWGWFAVIVALALFNTVLGEELLFRGYLLPRMSGEFGRRDWLANGVLFAVYHLHMPWAIPAALLGLVHPRLSLQALPQRAHRHRGAQRAERRHRRRRALPDAHVTRVGNSA